MIWFEDEKPRRTIRPEDRSEKKSDREAGKEPARGSVPREGVGDPDSETNENHRRDGDPTGRRS